MQVLGDTLEDIFKKFKCYDLVIAEYKRRATSLRRKIVVPRSDSIFCVTYCFNDVDSLTEIKVVKYCSTSNCFVKSANIRVGWRGAFNAVIHENKAFVLGGGSLDGGKVSECLKSVSIYNPIIRAILSNLNT